LFTQVYFDLGKSATPFENTFIPKPIIRQILIFWWQ